MLSRIRYITSWRVCWKFVMLLLVVARLWNIAQIIYFLASLNIACKKPQSQVKPHKITKGNVQKCWVDTRHYTVGMIILLFLTLNIQYSMWCTFSNPTLYVFSCVITWLVSFMSYSNTPPFSKQNILPLV